MGDYIEAPLKKENESHEEEVKELKDQLKNLEEDKGSLHNEYGNVVCVANQVMHVPFTNTLN